MLLEAPQIWRMKRYNVHESELVYILNQDCFHISYPKRGLDLYTKLD